MTLISVAQTGRHLGINERIEAARRSEYRPATPRTFEIALRISSYKERQFRAEDVFAAETAVMLVFQTNSAIGFLHKKT